MENEYSGLALNELHELRAYQQKALPRSSKLLDARELAELFGVPQSWVREQAHLGNLPSFKFGHYVSLQD